MQIRPTKKCELTLSGCLEAQRRLQQLDKELRQVTLAMGKPGVSERQQGIYQEEAMRLEVKMDTYQHYAEPLLKQVRAASSKYQEQLRRLEEAALAMRESKDRKTAAALARVFKRMLLHFRQERRGSRLKCHWQKELTDIILAEDEPINLGASDGRTILCQLCPEAGTG